MHEGAGISSEAFLILCIKIIVVEIPENWGNLGLVTVPSYTVNIQEVNS